LVVLWQPRQEVDNKHLYLLKELLLLILHFSQSDRLTQAIFAKWALKAVAPEIYGLLVAAVQGNVTQDPGKAVFFKGIES
jgi:hypothetical protein